MNLKEVRELQNSEQYKKYDEIFNLDENEIGFESAYDLAIQKLIEKDEEIKLLRDLQRSLNDRITRYAFGKF